MDSHAMTCPTHATNDGPPDRHGLLDESEEGTNWRHLRLGYSAPRLRVAPPRREGEEPEQPTDETVMAKRPNEIEFLSEVLTQVEDLPEGFAERLTRLVTDKTQDRAEAIRRLIEENVGG
jgi:hypothetical protein